MSISDQRTALLQAAKVGRLWGLSRPGTSSMWGLRDHGAHLHDAQGVRRACSIARGKAVVGLSGNGTSYFFSDPLSRIWSQVHTYLWRVLGRHLAMCQERRKQVWRKVSSWATLLHIDDVFPNRATLGLEFGSNIRTCMITTRKDEPLMLSPR